MLLLTLRFQILHSLLQYLVSEDKVVMTFVDILHLILQISILALELHILRLHCSNIPVTFS